MGLISPSADRHRRPAPWPARARRELIRVGLLAALLLLGSSALIAHDALHWQPQLDSAVCQLCLHHVAQDQIVCAASTFVAVHAPPALPLPVAVAFVVAAPRRRCRIRGPPLLFV